MKQQPKPNKSFVRAFASALGLCALLLTIGQSASGATATIYSENFDAYTGAATNLTDVSDADFAEPYSVFTDDNPTGADAGTGIQLVNLQSHSGPNALLLRPATELTVNLVNAKSGPKYTFDFWLYVAKGAGDRNFYLVLRGEGADINADDYIAYRSDRAATAKIFSYDGVGPGAAAWVDTLATHTEETWQHHRIVVDTAAQQLTVFVDDMTNSVFTGELARVEIPVPTQLRILHEGNSADDGYFIIDDISLTVDDSISLETVFREGFETYPARTSPDDDADPLGPWITVEADGTGSGKPRAPGKVQIVDSSVVPAHSGSRSLKLEGGQRAGASIAWGVPPESDVEITWWARVPLSAPGGQYNYLRMSLYGTEGGSSYAGDNALLGYGGRDGTIGDETSLTYYTTGWVDSGVDYTPDTWEEYRLTTHSAQGLYTIVKNPSSASPTVIADKLPFIGSATTWAPIFMAAWSSSNGTNHPPVYIDDIEIKSLVSNVNLGEPYTVEFNTSRFTNVTTLVLTNIPVGSVVVDPRDKSTILFGTDVAGGGIYRAAKTASGTWTIDSTPIVSGLDRPSGLTMGADGTIWWTHDYAGTLNRLKAPWASNSPEVVIAGFGAESATPDDDPIDVTVAPANFNGALGKPNMIVVADRGVNGDTDNALHLIDPATTTLDQTNYVNYLINPSPTDLSTVNLNAITALPQSGEVLVLSQDGFMTAVNGDGFFRYIPTSVLWMSGTPAANSIAVDPTTGRIWVTDDNLNEIWSIPSDSASTTPDQKEITFKLTDEARPDRAIDFHDPGLAFAPDGSFLVVTDTSTSNGGGRIVIFHNDAPAPPTFSFTGISSTATGGIQLNWQPAGNAKYRVQRATSLSNGTGFQDLSGVLTETQYTDATPPAGAAFYRIVVVP